jgi:hypothetical protein
MAAKYLILLTFAVHSAKMAAPAALRDGRQKFFLLAVSAIEGL